MRRWLLTTRLQVQVLSGTIMPFANKVVQKNYQKVWFQKNKKRLSKQQNYDRIKIKQKYASIIGKGCEICHENDIRCLVFHHINPKIKEESVVRLIRESNYKKIEKEVKKCILLCDNCHKIIHITYNITTNCNTKRRRKYRLELLKLLGNKCVICKEINPKCLVFHHNKKKTDTISNMLRMNRPMKTLKNEIKSCNIFCSNCHIKLHSKT